MRPLESFARAVVRHPVTALVVLFVVTIGISAFAVRLEMSTSFESFAPSGGASATLDEVRSDFGTGGAPLQVMVDAGAGGDVITPAGLAATQRVTSTVGAALGDRAVDTDRPATSWAQPIRGVLERFPGTGDSAGDTSAGGEPGPTPEAVDRATSATLSTPAGAQLAGLLSADLDPAAASARAGLVIVPLAAGLDSDTQVEAALDVRDAVEDLELEGFEPVVAGQPLAQNASSELTMSELPRLLGLSLALITVVLALVYRRFSDVAIGLLGLAVAIALTYGFGSLVGPGWLGWTGPFNQITTVVPILVVGLGIDFALHLTTRQREENRHAAPRRASRIAIVTVGGALALTTVTTAIGFLTNLFAPLPPIRDFGVFTAIGVAATFVAMMVLVPAGRTLVDRRSGSDTDSDGTDNDSDGTDNDSDGTDNDSDGLERDSDTSDTGSNGPERESTGSAPVPFVGTVARFSISHPVAILVVTALISIAAVVAALSVPTTFDTDDFIPSGSEAAEAQAQIEEVFGSDIAERTYVLMKGDLGQLDTARAMERSTDSLAAVPGVREGAGEALVEGPTQLLEEVSAAAPQTADRLASLGWTSEEGFADDADVPAIWEAAQQAAPRRAARAFEPGGDRQLLTVQTSAGQDGAERLVDQVREQLQPLSDAGVELQFTGQQLIFARTVDALKSSQLRSIGITVGAALVLLVGYFFWRERSVVLGLVAMVPTVLAATWVVGTMWLAELSFNVLTITIGSLAIAIGVDYGIHIAYRFREEHRQRGTEDAIVHTIGQTGGALAGSAATTAVGFGVLVLSSVLPIRQFGIITALTIVYSMIAAVVVMPAILRIVEGDDGDTAPGDSARGESPG